APADGVTRLYVNLLVPVVAGEPVHAISRAAAAADYASSNLGVRLPFEHWSFMNADLTLHMARVPADSWIGIESSELVAPNGSGLSHAALFDPKGRFGHSAQSLVVEPRARG